MRDLLRSSDGDITKAEFRRGAKFLVILTVAVIALFYGISLLSRSMAWMTVAIAPFFGVVVIFSVCSLIYFWFCIFAKRSRANGYSLMLVYVWLGTVFASSALRLLDYQNRTLGLTDGGLMPYAGFAALVLSLLAVILFTGLLVRNWASN